MIIKLISTLLLNACIKKRVYKKEKNRKKSEIVKYIMGGASSVTGSKEGENGRRD